MRKKASSMEKLTPTINFNENFNDQNEINFEEKEKEFVRIKYD